MSQLFSIDLKWRGFPVNLQVVETWMRANTTGYEGNSADTDLTLWFSEQPDESAISAYWAALTDASTEATSYQTADQIATAAAATKTAALASATTKLEALGLSAGEIAAILNK